MIIKKVKRSEINLADYNPRQMTEENKARLKRSIKDYGLIEPLIYNEVTKTLVGGHQRISVLDEEFIGQDYEVDVSVVNLSVDKEKALNVALNNENLAGTWDYEKLKDILTDLEKLPDGIVGTGFTEKDMADIFKEVRLRDLEEEEITFDEADVAMTVISFRVPEEIKKLVEKWIKYITDGEAMIRTFPSVEIDLRAFNTKISTENIHKDKITDEEAFFAFIAISYFNFIKHCHQEKGVYELKLLGSFAELKQLYIMMLENLKNKGKVPRNVKVMSLLDMLNAVK
jgi:hypothetical protein